MPYTAFYVSQLPDSVRATAEAHLLRHEISIWRRADHLLAYLLVFEWVAGIAGSLWRSPHEWAGATTSVNPHVLGAIFLGFAIITLPVALAVINPGRAITRHTIAVGQMLMSALLIHIGDGRIEMHFHIFGSLAFLAFYRDWRVLITATVVVAADHFVRGIYLPQSVYGVMSASCWRTLEHSGWVIFEDVFLIGSCVQGAREMMGIAVNRALLEQNYHDVEAKVIERTAELKNAQDELIKSARSAGMAEIATSVLHNVGNVLNSVNVSASLVAEKLRRSELPGLRKVSDLMGEHQPDLGNFLTGDQRGKLIPGFIAELANCLNEEQALMLTEVDNLNRGINHIKQIVTAQQSMAKTSQLPSEVNPAGLLETALSMGTIALWSGVQIVRHIEPGPELIFDQHKVLQILLNLLGNARHAVMSLPAGMRRIQIDIERARVGAGEILRYRITDNGVGIPQENLTRIFAHGFTTKKEGHGFGLHSSANAATEMGGSLTVFSEGMDKGATFTLEIPVQMVFDIQSPQEIYSADAA